MPATLAPRPPTGRRPHAPTPPRPVSETRKFSEPREALRRQAARAGQRLGEAHHGDPYRLAAALGLKTSIVKPWDVRHSFGRPLARGEQVAAYLSDAAAPGATVYLVEGIRFGPPGWALARQVAAWLYAYEPLGRDDGALAAFADAFLRGGRA